MIGCLLHAPPTGHRTHNPGTCPDRESNLRPFAFRDHAQPTEPHRPGRSVPFQGGRQEVGKTPRPVLAWRWLFPASPVLSEVIVASCVPPQTTPPVCGPGFPACCASCLPQGAVAAARGESGVQSGEGHRVDVGRPCQRQRSSPEPAGRVHCLDGGTGRKPSSCG